MSSEEEKSVLDLEQEMIKLKSLEESRISKILLPGNEKSELIDAFSNLNTNNKRNTYNNEIIKLFEILKEYMRLNTTDELYNYNSYMHSILDEDNYLVLEYQNIMKIRQYVLNAIAIKATNHKDN